MTRTKPTAVPGPRHQIGALLALVRLALLAGVLLAGGVVWAMRRDAGAPPDVSIETLRGLRSAGLLAWSAAVVGVSLMFLRLLRRPTTPPHGQVIATWALAELPALYGVVRFWITGEPRWYLLGVVFMLGVLAIVPARLSGR